MEQNELTTEHQLDFEACPNPLAVFFNSQLFRVGTCEGVWLSIPDCYVIISVVNNTPGNGHLNDVFQWFEHSCKRDNKNLLVVECLNSRFYLHLLKARGFIPLDTGGENCIRVFNKRSYKKLLKKGNEILIAGTLTCV